MDIRGEKHQRLVRAAVAEKVYTAKKGGRTALFFGTGSGKLDLHGEGYLESTISEDQVPTLVL